MTQFPLTQGLHTEVNDVMTGILRTSTNTKHETFSQVDEVFPSLIQLSSRRSLDCSSPVFYKHAHAHQEICFISRKDARGSVHS